jgi:hypothetical protein
MNLFQYAGTVESRRNGRLAFRRYTEADVPELMAKVRDALLS